MTYKLTCRACGNLFDATRADAQSCGATCRGRLHRSRRDREIADLRHQLARLTAERAEASRLSPIPRAFEITLAEAAAIGIEPDDYRRQVAA